MATSPRTATSSTKAVLNGTSRQIKSVRRQALATGKALKAEVVRDGRLVSRRATELFSSAARATRQHPYAAAGVVALGAALIGGLLWSRRR